MRSVNQSSGHLTGRFFELLQQVNRPRPDGFKQWLFHPGMLFRAREQWWGQELPRPTPHEGLDLCRYEDSDGKRRQVDQTMVIPAPFPGMVVKISRDFLGQSIFLAHSEDTADGLRLYTAFGHTRPVEGLAEGQAVAEADIIASVSRPARKTSVPPHLHLTLAWIPGNVGYDQLTWEFLGKSPEVHLLDPLVVFPTSYLILTGP
jgi:hypothetical protein